MFTDYCDGKSHVYVPNLTTLDHFDYLEKYMADLM
jgi:hypothetical protein